MLPDLITQFLFGGGKKNGLRHIQYQSASAPQQYRGVKILTTKHVLASVIQGMLVTHVKAWTIDSLCMVGWQAPENSSQSITGVKPLKVKGVWNIYSNFVPAFTSSFSKAAGKDRHKQQRVAIHTPYKQFLENTTIA